ncbi:MAG TPA: hypothetical protein DCW90_06070 [Lachnospiraceae bacterium]|nr:hypothetical protein [uncultured Lachnoclostridium sp.]HAU85063.1 hypothetical protein [Lachnospiraceae bacterium]
MKKKIIVGAVCGSLLLCSSTVYAMGNNQASKVTNSSITETVERAHKEEKSQSKKNEPKEKVQSKVEVKKEIPKKKSSVKNESTIKKESSVKKETVKVENKKSSKQDKKADKQDSKKDSNKVAAPTKKPVKKDKVSKPIVNENPVVNKEVAGVSEIRELVQTVDCSGSIQNALSNSGCTLPQIQMIVGGNCNKEQIKNILNKGGNCNNSQIQAIVNQFCNNGNNSNSNCSKPGAIKYPDKLQQAINNSDCSNSIKDALLNSGCTSNQIQSIINGNCTSSQINNILSGSNCNKSQIVAIKNQFCKR